jgi:cystathionine beta-lyase/cystathionine gamma-synthase
MLEGFGPVVSFEAHGGAAAATGIVNRLELVGHGPSLGSVESLASLPAFTSHVNLGEEGRRRAGIAEGMVRLSIGLEDVGDLWSDLDQAVTAAAARAEARS